jgi:hypothetical protein
MTVTALGTGDNTYTFASGATANRPSVNPAGGGALVAFAVSGRDGAASSGGNISNSGGTGTAPSWQVGTPVHNGSGVGIVSAYAVNGYSASWGGTVVGSFTAADLTGITVVEITGFGVPTFLDRDQAPGASALDLDVCDLIVAAGVVLATTDHDWTGSGYTELIDNNDGIENVMRASLAYDESTPGDPSFTPNTGTRCVAAIGFTTSPPATLEQAAFRWYDDDADPTTATALAAQDEDLVNRPVETPTILRVRVQATNDPSSIIPVLQWKVVGDPASEWEDLA